MNELRHPCHFGNAGQSLLEPVFDRLDVVIGLPFDRLDAGGVVDREALGNFGDGGSCRIGERRHLRDRRFGRQRGEPRELDAHAMANEAELAELAAQRGDLAHVAPVERR